MRQQRRFAARWRDRLLFPVALLFVLFEALFRNAARLLLATVACLPGMARARDAVARLPATVVLPLFVVPEAISHLAGFAATYLLARGHFVSAISLAVVVKGVATLTTVWIYQAAAATLLGVPWFARVHGWALQLRAWTLDRISPARQALARYWLSRQPRADSAIGRWLRRFRAMRTRLEIWVRRRGHASSDLR